MGWIPNVKTLDFNYEGFLTMTHFQGDSTIIQVILRCELNKKSDGSDPVRSIAPAAFMWRKNPPSVHVFVPEVIVWLPQYFLY